MPIIIFRKKKSKVAKTSSNFWQKKFFQSRKKKIGYEKIEVDGITIYKLFHIYVLGFKFNFLFPLKKKPY